MSFAEFSEFYVQFSMQLTEFHLCVCAAEEQRNLEDRLRGNMREYE